MTTATHPLTAGAVVHWRDADWRVAVVDTDPTVSVWLVGIDNPDRDAIVSPEELAARA